ncbi:Serine/threonine-protein phosphatase 5 [Apostasia shenzhenica]|uniref:Serine/threonine-protein phosphatase 5 n=1 Tax=Apostasia shenzhenica TaxID=1088818 RepID=A0A2I0AV81_9ASPA|nr:Serine/threonine-protein phosphatase 5 [Apostasia shenzhenica]
MALWMDAGAEPVTCGEREDLDAIAALKESAAIELKEQGNSYLKLGKKYYSDAIDCYTRAINQKALSNSDQSIIYANRAQVNLLLGNYRRALEDAEEAINLCSNNIKAYYRAAKAAFSLDLLSEAARFCKKALEHSPSNDDMKKLSIQIETKKKKIEHHMVELSKAVDSAKELISAFSTRGLKFGKPMYQDLIGVRKPILDKSGVLHWPVLLLYAEVMSSDFVEEFYETDMLSAHLDEMYSESYSALPWDMENAYTRDAIELYYLATGTVLSKKEVLEYLVQYAAASAELVSSEPNDEENHFQVPASAGSGEWIKVDEKSTLSAILRQPDYIIPGIPVFFVVSKKSIFYNEFRNGKWRAP